jgi:peptidoglycan endopeptidase LytE
MVRVRRLITACAATAALSTPLAGVLLVPAVTHAADPNTYVIANGDTLIGIAGRAGVRLSALLSANDLEIDSLILPGQRLTIPAGGTVPQPVAPPSSSGGANQIGGSASAAHQVRAGDTLIGVAAKYEVRLAALLAANNMTISSLILPGMQLALPAGAAIPTPAPPPQTPGTSAGTASSTPPASSGIPAVVDYALAQQGKPYKFFSAGPESFDCSGLTKAAYEQVGIKLVHHSASQARQGRSVDLETETIQAGDLVFLSTRGSETINHVGIAISSTRWIHAVGTGDVVRVGWMPAKVSITEVRRFNL